MTIRDLIKELAGENPDRKVVDANGIEITVIEIGQKPNTIEIH
jgi:hypothetical protein|tara:strand:+ start:1767 stop:1895 length:129 start_codon:yes stop_codon:yes gene_type:complete